MFLREYMVVLLKLMNVVSAPTRVGIIVEEMS
jgi:hypothetical protein